MSRKFSVTAIDLDKIYDEIENYVNQNGDFNPYIFMNEDTARAILFEVGVAFQVVKKDAEDRMYNATFAGYKVFINNDLRFGIVEIR